MTGKSNAGALDNEVRVSVNIVRRGEDDLSGWCTRQIPALTVQTASCWLADLCQTTPRTGPSRNKRLGIPSTDGITLMGGGNTVTNKYFYKNSLCSQLNSCLYKRRIRVCDNVLMT